MLRAERNREWYMEYEKTNESRLNKVNEDLVNKVMQVYGAMCE